MVNKLSQIIQGGLGAGAMNRNEVIPKHVSSPHLQMQWSSIYMDTLKTFSSIFFLKYFVVIDFPPHPNTLPSDYKQLQQAKAMKKYRAYLMQGSKQGQLQD